MKLKPGLFTGKFLRLDEDGDYVLKSLPCFLGEIIIAAFMKSDQRHARISTYWNERSKNC